MRKFTTIAVMAAAALAVFAGTPAATDGWVADAASLGFTHGDGCASSLPLLTTMSSSGVGVGSPRGWTWTAADGTSLVEADLYRSLVLTPGDADAAPTATIAAGSNVIESHAGSMRGSLLAWNDPSNHITAQGGSLVGNTLSVGLGCAGIANAACPNTGSTKSAVRLYAATFTLADNSTPTITNVTGSLASGAVKSGVERLTLSADDTGAGIYRTIVKVDGVPVATTTPNTNAGRCVDAIPNDSDDHQFQHQVPCPLHLDGIAVPLDTRSLADGLHLLDVQVEDAAGNRSSAFGGPTTIPVDNTPPPVQPTPVPPAPNPGRTQQPATGANAGAAATPGAINGVGGGAGAQISVAVLQSSHRLVHLAYGRSVTLSGRLVTRDGTPVSNAVVE